MTRRNRATSRQNRRVQSVTVVDKDAGMISAKIDRQIASLQESQSQMRVLCNTVVGLSVTTTAAGVYYSFGTISGTDDFVSAAQQFKTFRVSSIRFEVVDTAPNAQATGIFATAHTGGTIPDVSTDNVTDHPDSKVIVPGSNREYFYWKAKGTLENEFQNLAGGNYYDFGGLVANVVGPTAVSGKYLIIIKAVVDFRGRK